MDQLDCADTNISSRCCSTGVFVVLFPNSCVVFLSQIIDWRETASISNLCPFILRWVVVNTTVIIVTNGFQPDWIIENRINNQPSICKRREIMLEHRSSIRLLCCVKSNWNVPAISGHREDRARTETSANIPIDRTKNSFKLSNEVSRSLLVQMDAWHLRSIFSNGSRWNFLVWPVFQNLSVFSHWNKRLHWKNWSVLCLCIISKTWWRMLSLVQQSD